MKTIINIINTNFFNVFFVFFSARRKYVQLERQDRRRFGSFGARLEVRRGAQRLCPDAEDPRPQSLDVVDEAHHSNGQSHRSPPGALESPQ